MSPKTGTSQTILGLFYFTVEPLNPSSYHHFMTCLWKRDGTFVSFPSGQAQNFPRPFESGGRWFPDGGEYVTRHIVVTHLCHKRARSKSIVRLFLAIISRDMCVNVVIFSTDVGDFHFIMLKSFCSSVSCHVLKAAVKIQPFVSH